MSDNLNLEKKLTEKSLTDHELAIERTQLAFERNRLANQRTYLAWIRSGLACVGGGVAILRLLTFEQFTHRLIAQIVGGILILLGIAIFSLAFADYKLTYIKLKRAFGVEYAGSIVVITVITVTLCVLAFLLLYITFQPNQI